MVSLGILRTLELSMMTRTAAEKQCYSCLTNEQVQAGAQWGTMRLMELRWPNEATP